MTPFLGFVKKEFFHIFRDYRTVLILFGMPVVQLILFGYILTNEIKDAGIAVFDQSRDEMTTKITQKLISSGYFKLNGTIDNYEDIERAFRKGKIKEVVVFEPQFALKLEKEGKAHVQIITDASEPNTANLLTNYTTGIINSFSRDLNLLKTSSQMINTEVRMYYNQDLKGVFMFLPGIMAMLLTLISAMMTSVSITREKEQGTMEVLLVSPLKPFQIIIGKVMPYIGLAFADALVIILLGFFVFKMPIAGSLALLMAESLLFIILALSLGILISTRTDSQQIAMMISMVALMLPTILLSGFIFPIENMPKLLQWLAAAMPPKYFIIIVKSIMLKGNGFFFVWKETLILAGMTLLFIALSVKNFKTRLQ